jgi:hypothetical protein
METETRNRLQIGLIVVFVLVLLRTGVIMYQRAHADDSATQKPAGRVLKGDDFVYLRSLHAYDLKSLKKLEGSTVWVRAGNAVAFFPSPGAKKDAGVLPPAASLKVTKIVKSGSQFFALFNFDEPESPKATFAVPVGAEKDGSANLIVDELFFYENPEKLYAHWPKDTWTSVHRHEIVKGMNENQAGMAMGVTHEVGSGSGDYGNRTLEYTHEGKTVQVMFANNAAVRVEEIKR